MKATFYNVKFAGILLLLWMLPALAGDDVESSVAELQHGWASVLYQTPPQQKDATYRQLADKAEQVTSRYPGRIEPMVWEAIILGSYADYQNGLAALGKLKQARELLQTAEKMDATAMQGFIPMVLGVLHYKAPGWPLSFGDDKKALAYLQAALRIDPAGIDQNFYYGEFLVRQHDYTQARIYLEKALAAAPRAGREDADSGRRAEIGQIMKKMEP
jgi:tetratricopeptide (TPR) repeat protein